MNNANLISKKAKNVMNIALDFIGSIESIDVNNNDELNNAGLLCGKIKTHLANIDNERKTLLNPHNDNIKKINYEFAAIKVKLQNGEIALKKAMEKYVQIQEHIQLEAARIAEAKAEEVRRIAETKAKNERAKEQKYRYEGRDEMADMAAARAQAAQDRADYTIADIPNESIKIKGTSFRTDYDVEITNKQLAAKYMLDDFYLEGFVCIDVRALKKDAKTRNGKMTIPGVKIIKKKKAIQRKM